MCVFDTPMVGAVSKLVSAAVHPIAIVHFIMR